MMEEQDQSDMGKKDGCKLKVYSKRNKRAPVFITDFSHGEVKSIPHKSDLKFQCFKKDASVNNVGSDATRELVVNNGRLNYVGSSSQSTLQYFVGVRNKTTGKMKLYDCVLFRMKPELKKMVSSCQPAVAKSYWEGMNELTENFGSKAKKRALSTLQKCNVDSSLDKSLPISDTFLRSPDKSDVNDGQHQVEYLPPQNRNASLPSEVYDINDLISPEEDNALNQEAQELLSAPAAQFQERFSSFCKYAGARVKNVTASRAKLLLYYNYLISFQHLKYADLRKKDPAPGIPNPYKINILEKFTLVSSNDKGRVSRSCPNQMKDKLIAYILVLALFIDDYRVNLEEVHMDLNNVGVPKLKTIAGVLGCHTSVKKAGEETANCAELKLPLNDFKQKFSKKPSSKKF